MTLSDADADADTDAALAARFALAQDVAREAGALAAGYFADLASLTVRSKGLQDVVSEADLNTELLIRDRLKAAFPQDAFFGEETGPQAIEGAEGIWVVDPIDGTQPFLNGLRNWCVSIAFVHRGRPEIGVVFDPVNDELFLARRGHGAFLNGRPIRVHAGRSLTEGVISVGYSTRVPPQATLDILARLFAAGGIFHRNGSGTLSLCYVACARLLGYVEVHINAWDCLAALVLIEEAGGVTSDFLAGEGMTKGNPLIAGPPAIYPALEALLG